MANSSRPAIEPELFTPKEAAAYLGVSRSTIYELMNCGKLESVRVMRSRKIRRTCLERIVAEGTGE